MKMEIKIKIKIIFVLTIVFVLISGILLFKNKNKNKNYIKINGYPNLNIMVSYNGNILNKFPDKDNQLFYDVFINCDNADAKWDYESWEMVVTNLKQASKCMISFTSSPKKTLYDKIVSDWNNNDGSKNIYKEEHVFENGTRYYEYRYEGADLEVENYVWFNNELWRIIGAFPGGVPSIAIGGSNLAQGNAAPSINNTVKIIRNDPIGDFVWSFSISWINAILNYNVLNDLYLNSKTGTCNYSNNVTKSCNFTVNGLKNVYNYIEDATWNLGGSEYYKGDTAVNMYKLERGTFVYDELPSLTTAKVGLMYPSDYGYSKADDTCQAECVLGDDYDCDENCKIDRWLHIGREQTITSQDYTYAQFIILYDGRVYGGDLETPYSVRPVVYLKSNVYVTGGDGSIANPYQIAIG